MFALKYLFKFLCFSKQISIKITTFIDKFKSNNIIRTRSNFDFAKINQNILFICFIFYLQQNQQIDIAKAINKY